MQTALTHVPDKSDTSQSVSPYGIADARLTAPNPAGGPANRLVANGNAIDGTMTGTWFAKRSRSLRPPTRVR